MVMDNNFTRGPALPEGVVAITGMEWIDADALPKIGDCCACVHRPATFFFSINRKCPTASDGAWGCFVCGATRGAAIVLCRRCWQARVPVRFGCDGNPGNGKRLPIEMFVIPCEHDLSKHPEVFRNPPPISTKPEDN